MLCKVNVEIRWTKFVSPVISVWQQRASHVGWCPNVRPGSLLTPGLWLVTGCHCWPLIGWWWPGLTRRGPGKIQTLDTAQVAQWSHSGGQFESRLILRHWMVQHKQNIELRMWTLLTLILPPWLSAHRQPYKVSERRYHQNVNQRETLHWHVTFRYWCETIENWLKSAKLRRGDCLSLLEAPVRSQWSGWHPPETLIIITDIIIIITDIMMENVETQGALIEENLSGWIPVRAVGFKSIFSFLHVAVIIFVKNVPLSAHISTRGW